MIDLDFDFMDPDAADNLLELTLGNKVVNTSILAKSFYNFDFSTPEGVVSFLELLPLLDTEVIKQAAAELWPGFVDETFDVKRARFEIRAYLMDMLASGIVADPEAEKEAAESATEEIQQVNDSQESEEEPQGEEAAPEEETPPADEEVEDNG